MKNFAGGQNIKPTWINMMNNKKINGVSVVICCYNSSKLILPTLYALKVQQLPKDTEYEVILIDNGCTDNTAKISREYWGSHNIKLKIVEESRQGILYSRIRGVENASYDIIIFVDDDNILNNDYLKRTIQLFNTMPNVGIAGGYSQPLIQSSSIPGWFLKFQNVYACGPQSDRRIYGAGLCIRTSLAKEIYKNESSLILIGNQGSLKLRGDDTEICHRAILKGYDLYYDPSLTLRHNLLFDRLNWKRVCYYRTVGGMVRPVFWIYEDLIIGKEPLNLFELTKKTMFEWFKLLKNPYNLFLLFKEGERVSYNYYSLKGITLFIIKHHKKYKLYVRQLKELTG